MEKNKKIKKNIPEYDETVRDKGCGRGFALGGRNFMSAFNGEWVMGRVYVSGLTFGLMMEP